MSLAASIVTTVEVGSPRSSASSAIRILTSDADSNCSSSLRSVTSSPVTTFRTTTPRSMPTASASRPTGSGPGVSGAMGAMELLEGLVVLAAIATGSFCCPEPTGTAVIAAIAPNATALSHTCPHAE